LLKDKLEENGKNKEERRKDFYSFWEENTEKRRREFQMVRKLTLSDDC